MEDGVGQQASGDDSLVANRVIFYSQAYTTLMEQARAAMPGETVGILFGDVHLASESELWVTVKEIAPLRLTGGDTMEPRLDTLKKLLGRAGKHASSQEVVGWFYADPGTGIFSPRVPLEEIQRQLPASATLFLLSNPATNQGAFFWWDGTSYTPSDGFYEAVPNESSPPLVMWDGEVRGARSWLGGRLADPPLTLTPESGEYAPISQLEEPKATLGEDIAARVASSEAPQSPNEDDTNYSAPIYIEVITEEPVEYVAPDELTPSGDPPANNNTQPYPIEADTKNEPVTAEAPPAREAPPTSHLGSLTGKLNSDEVTGSGDLPDDDEPPSGSTQTGPLDLVQGDSGPTTSKLQAIEGMQEKVEPHAHAIPQPLPTWSGVSSVLAPVGRSRVRPVMKRRDWREVVLSLVGLLCVAIILVVLIGGLPALQNSPPPAGSPITAEPSLNQDNAQAGNSANPSTLLPDATLTITVTSTPLTPAIEPAQTPTTKTLPPVP